MRYSAILMLWCLWSPCSIFASTDWPNEPAGSQVMLDCPMNDVNCGGQLWTPTPGKLTQHSGAPLSAPNALTSHLPAGASQGGQHTTWPTSASARAMNEIYVGFWWKMNADFQGLLNSTNKLFFIRNWEFSFGKNAVNGVFLLLGQPDKFPWSMGWFHNTGGLDNTHACATNCFPNVGSVPLNRDTWYRVEAYVKSSTCSTCRDGIVRWWINGTLVGNYTNINYGSGNMNEFTISHTWDGSAHAACYNATTNPSGRDCSREWLHHFDHLHISAPNCGASGCPVAIPLGISTNSPLPPAQIGRAYSATIQAAGGNAPYFWSFTGSLPPGLTTANNVISGTPTTIGSYAFTAKVTDATGATSTKSLTIIVSRPSGIGGKQLTVNGLQLTVEPGIGGVLFRPHKNRAYSLSVFDLSGRELWKHAGSGDALWNHGGNLKKGVYLIRAEQNGKAIYSTSCHVQ